MINSKYMRILQKICFLLIIVIWIEGCKGPSSEESAVQQKTPLEKFQAQAGEIIPYATDPTDLAVLFQLTAADFIPELIHDPVQWENYKGKPLQAAANFGIYTADAIYQYIFKETEGAYLSWMAAKSIAADLGFAEIFDQIVIKRVEQGLTPQDSLFNQIDLALEKMGSTYTEADRLRMYTTLVTGNYVEKLHIVMGTLFDSNMDLPEETRLLLNREMLLILIKQLRSLEKLIALIEEHETIDDPGYLSYELKSIRDIFNAFDLSDDNLAHLTPDMVFRNEKINELREHVGRIRVYAITGVPLE